MMQLYRYIQPLLPPQFNVTFRRIQTFCQDGSQLRPQLRLALAESHSETLESASHEMYKKAQDPNWTLYLSFFTPVAY